MRRGLRKRVGHSGCLINEQCVLPFELTLSTSFTIVLVEPFWGVIHHPTCSSLQILSKLCTQMGASNFTFLDVLPPNYIPKIWEEILFEAVLLKFGKWDRFIQGTRLGRPIHPKNGT